MAKKDDVKITASAKTVSNDKTKKQEEELLASKKKKEEADAKAKKARENSAKKKEESVAKNDEIKKEEASTIDTTKIIETGASVASGVLSSKKTKGFFSGLIIGIVIGVLITSLIGASLKDQLLSKVETTKQSADEIIDETLTGYTAVDFKDAILGEASQHQELIVMEQPLEISTTITKAGLGNLEIFSKVKNISYAGTGVYTTDFKYIDSDHISVDEENKVVTIKIQNTTLQYVNIDNDNITFEDTDKGLLAFGDLSLTTEQQNELEKSVKEAMREKLNTSELLEKANEFAKMKAWEIFQPIVSAVSPEYTVEIEFDD